MSHYLQLQMSHYTIFVICALADSTRSYAISAYYVIYMIAQAHAIKYAWLIWLHGNVSFISIMEGMHNNAYIN